MNVKQATSTLFLTAAIGFVPSSAFAYQCFEPSALFIEHGEEYTEKLMEAAFPEEFGSAKVDSNVRKTSRSKRSSRRSSKRSVNSDLISIVLNSEFEEGIGTRHSCFGPESNPDLRIVEFELDEFSYSKRSDDSLTIKAIAESKDRVRPLMMDFQPAEKWIEDSNGTWTNTTSFRRTVHRRNNRVIYGSDINNGFTERLSTLNEVQTSLNKTQSGIKISRAIYTHGHLVEC